MKNKHRGFTLAEALVTLVIIGVIAGAYTSIVVVSPFWASWKQSEIDAKQNKR